MCRIETVRYILSVHTVPDPLCFLVMSMRTEGIKLHTGNQASSEKPTKQLQVTLDWLIELRLQCIDTLHSQIYNTLVEDAMPSNWTDEEM